MEIEMRWLEHKRAIPGIYFLSWVGWMLFFVPEQLPNLTPLFTHATLLAFAFSLSRFLGACSLGGILFPEIYGLLMVLGSIRPAPGYTYLLAGGRNL